MNNYQNRTDVPVRTGATANGVEILDLPTMNFNDDGDDAAQSEPTTNADGIEVLDLPKMNFEKAKTSKPSGSADNEVLDLPRMEF